MHVGIFSLHRTCVYTYLLYMYIYTLLTYLPTYIDVPYLPTYIHIYVYIYLTYLPTYIHIPYLPIYIHTLPTLPIPLPLLFGSTNPQRPQKIDKLAYK